MARKLVVEIIGDTRDLEKALQRSGKSSQTFGSRLKGMAKIAGPAAAAGAVALLTKGLISSVGAAKDAEAAQSRLQQALRNAGISFKDHGAAIEDAIQKTSRLAALDDEDLSDSFSKLIRVTKDVQKATEGMALAADIARARNISLEAATKFVEKALAGNDAAFSRIGIKLKKNQDATDALRIATERFGGAAAAHGKTAAGAQERLGVAFENLQEKIGQKVLPTFTKLMEQLVLLIEWAEREWPKWEKSINQGMDAARDAFQKISPVLKLILGQIRDLVQFVAAIMRGDWAEAWKNFKQLAINGIKLLWAAIRLEFDIARRVATELGEKILDGIKTGIGNLGEAIREKIDNAIDFGQNLLDRIHNAGVKAGKALIQGIADGLRGLGGFLAGVAVNLGNLIVRGIIGAINSVLQAINDAIPNSFGKGPLKVNFPDNPIPLIPVPQLAQGGIVTKPTLAMIGEGGPEAVIPLGSPAARGAVGGTMVFNFPNYVGDKRDLERAMRDAAQTYFRRNAREVFA